MSTQPPAIRIDTDGAVTVLPDASYETIRDGVGGWIEAALTDESLTLWINEEGKIDRLPFNPLGHALWNEVDIYGCIPAGDWLAGPCVVTGPPDNDGNATAVPDWLLPRLARLAATIVVIELQAGRDG
ncbi:MAG: DUF3846 domain-containing protein [Acidimicrobiia bacterium]